MVHVTTEIGRLRRVLVHEPGVEVDHMVPSMMEELLFDDILYGDRAREEHARFRRLMQLLGVEVVDASDLLEETLADGEARDWILDVLLEDLPAPLRHGLHDTAPGELATKLVGGIRATGGGATEEDGLFALAPLPNWCFQRDPQVVIGDGVAFSAMATPARHREALLARSIFRFHPGLAPDHVLHDPLEPERERPSFVDLERPMLEGGDVLLFSPDVVAVGHSERSNPTGIRHLARTLAREPDGPRWLLVVELPRRRAFMHLDTLITPIDRDACLLFPPVMLPGGGGEGSRVHAIDLRDRELRATPRDGLLEALRERGIDLEPIACGGDDPLSQVREQWTDGANALALAPGVIALYDRNVATAEALDRRGFRIVEAEDVLLGREEIDLDEPSRTCVLVSSHEISRGRGGPHCLTHPLHRDDA